MLPQLRCLGRGIESARIIHRVMALLLLAETAYHILALIYRSTDRPKYEAIGRYVHSDA